MTAFSLLRSIKKMLLVASTLNLEIKNLPKLYSYIPPSQLHIKLWVVNLSHDENNKRDLSTIIFHNWNLL